MLQPRVLDHQNLVGVLRQLCGKVTNIVTQEHSRQGRVHSRGQLLPLAQHLESDVPQFALPVLCQNEYLAH